MKKKCKKVVKKIGKCKSVNLFFSFYILHISVADNSIICNIRKQNVKSLKFFYAFTLGIFFNKKGTVPPLYPIAIIRRRARLVTCELGLYIS